jgi:gliding motility-associated-like protein
VATLCPGGGAGSGAASAVNFLSFQVGSFLDPGDQLVVHDGIGTASTVLATGNVNNSLAGLTFTASGASGCLTFHWSSGLFGDAPGWQAEVITGPDAGASASLTLCGNQPAFLLFDALGGDPDVGGAWTGPLGPHAPLYDPATDPGGAYTYTVIDGSLCRDSASVTITNVAAPDPGEDGVLLLCNVGPPVQLINSLGGSPSAGGSWTGPSGPHDGSFDPTADAAGIYTYSVGGNAPCPNAAATVTVALTGEADAGNNGSLVVCDTVVALDLFEGLGGSPDIGGTWTDGSGAPQGSIANTSLLGAGSHTFTYSVAVPGCGSDVASVEVQVIGSVQVIGLARLCEEAVGASVISFTVTGGDADSYTVTGVPGLLASSPPFVFTSQPLPDSLAYTIVVADANACGQAVLNVAACTYPPNVFIPQSFSPNGDGINDTFRIPGLEDFPGNEILIFNRWGSEVYRATDYHEPYKAWRGSRDNASSTDLLPATTNFYVLDLGNGSEVRKGFVYITP